jgi:hypothetical protein
MTPLADIYQPARAVNALGAGAIAVPLYVDKVYPDALGAPACVGLPAAPGTGTYGVVDARGMIQLQATVGEDMSDENRRCPAAYLLAWRQRREAAAGPRDRLALVRSDPAPRLGAPVRARRRP